MKFSILIILILLLTVLTGTYATYFDKKNSDITFTKEENYKYSFIVYLILGGIILLIF